MSRRIFRDVEEAISREVRRITFKNTRTLDLTVLEDVYDPVTGEIISSPIQPNFYDSSADTNHIQYPHFFVRLLTTREDRYTGRVIPEYGKELQVPVVTAPQAYSIILNGADGTISAPGNTITTTNFQIRKIQPGYLLRLTLGNNIGTYIVSTVVPNNSGIHTITVSNSLIINLPANNFKSDTRQVYFSSPVDLHTVQVGDVFTDASSVTFNITAVDFNKNNISVDGSSTPSLAFNSTITRTGNVFKNSEISIVPFIILDPAAPVVKTYYTGDAQSSSQFTGISPPIPIDAYYLIRIDSKERESHIDVLNRMWEEFNPPRTALPTIIRSPLSADQLLTVDVTTGGSSTITIKDNSNYNINDPVFIFDDFTPTKSSDGGFQEPFQSVVIGKVSNNQLILANTVPDTFQVSNNTRIVSNAQFYLLMFHFVDHKTKDVEGAQYWVNEFTFWVQFWIDRQGDITDFNSVVQKIDPSIESLDTNTVIFP